jgi:hypothetical protein
MEVMVLGFLGDYAMVWVDVDHAISDDSIHDHLDSIVVK